MEQERKSAMDEKDILSGCLEGGPESYRGLLEAYGPLVTAVAINILGNREDAEDVCQETFLQVFKNFDRYDPGRSFKTWLLTIVYRRSLDMIRKKRRFVEFATRAKFDPSAASAAKYPTNPGPPGPLPSRYLKGLTPKERTALCLWANEGYAAGDISEVLGCSASTARVTLFNARRKIKAILEKDHGVLQVG
jgi:RNA polymerase sigma-70 factor (ECF subfamily)